MISSTAPPSHKHVFLNWFLPKLDGPFSPRLLLLLLLRLLLLFSACHTGQEALRTGCLLWSSSPLVLTDGDAGVSVAGCLCFCHVSCCCPLSAGPSFSLLSGWISSALGNTEPDEGVAGCSLPLCCAFLVTLPRWATLSSFLPSPVEEAPAEIT